MIFNFLKVISDLTYCYEFNKNTMIYSSENSKGKTTLIRFLLYSLGYSVPATEGIGDFSKFEFELTFENCGKKYILWRKSDNITLKVEEEIFNFHLPEEMIELHSLIFNINNPVIINNLLAVYYIDQEKGWTLLNRGKIIGNIRFNIEEFIAGLSDRNISELINEKNVINGELKKYRYFRNVIDINNEFEDVDNQIDAYERSPMNFLLEEQRNLELKLKKVVKTRKKVEESLKNNGEFANLIENYGLLVNHNGEQFLITKKELVDYKSNQDLLKIRINNCKVEEEKLKSELAKITMVINEKNTLFSVDDILSQMEKTIDKIEVDSEQIDKAIRQLTNKRNSINRQIKDKLSFNNDILYHFYIIIQKYSTELGIIDYISDKTPRFVLTNKLKGLSGRILAQMSFVFKLAYIKSVENKYGLKLPIIIDSPRTNELSEESTNAMMSILKRDFSDNQIIVASIYDSSIITFDKINLENGLLSDKFLKNN